MNKGAPEPVLSEAEGSPFRDLGERYSHPTGRLAEYPSQQMPRGLVRYQQTGDFHFLTFSCHRRLPHLATAAARDRFESALERTRRRYNFVVAGYVVMPEHVHLLVSEPRKGLLARAVQALKLSVSVRSVQRPFWQPRYYDFNVHNEKKRVEKLRYMHRNPVVRGLCAKPEDWPWSSYRHYATGLAGTVEIESEWTAARRGGHLPEGWEARMTGS
jgi:putative transposase